MKIDELTISVKVDNDDYKKAMNKLNEKIQEIKNIKNDISIILNDLDNMLDGKGLLIAEKKD